MDEIPGLAARRAALTMLDAVLRRGETLAHAAGAANALGTAADRALARAITAETLRWLVDLDALIDGATPRPLPDDAKSRMVLRMMLAQTLRLDIPVHAVIATALPLLAGGPRRLAHAVFSTVINRTAPSPGADRERAALLPAFPTLPPVVAARWGERADAIARALAQPPPLDLTLRDPAETGVWAERLGGRSLCAGHVRVARGRAVEMLPGFGEGAWWAQDLAASLPARLIGAPPGGGREGAGALDLCAAPGGKTLQLAAAGWQVTALDLSDRRLALLRDNLARTGLAATLVCADALAFEPDRLYDAILLDAPCTATGTCRRHPDVIHRIGARQIAEMAALQARLLARAVRWLAPGGRLVYAVCSLERAEGEAQPPPAGLLPDPVTAADLGGAPVAGAITADGALRTDPGMLDRAGGLDGFYIARWRAPA